MKKLIIICLLICFQGCINTTTINVESTKTWEGHYKNVDEFKEATKNIKLNDNESIWVLSNKTLNRVLKNIESK